MPQSRRKYERKSVICDAQILMDDQVIACEIKDISAGGASALAAEKLDDARQTVTLSIRPFGDFTCDVAWKNGKRLGLRFHNDPEMMAEIVLAMAVYG